jgi:hypothetical protein
VSIPPNFLLYVITRILTGWENINNCPLEDTTNDDGQRKDIS